MFITKKACRGGRSCGAWARRSRCRCWMRWCPRCRPAPAAPPRLGFIYVPNGVIQNQWKPRPSDRHSSCRRSSSRLANRSASHFNVLSGLSHLQADTFGDGTGDHPRASAVWLTGVHAYDRPSPASKCAWPRRPTSSRPADRQEHAGALARDDPSIRPRRARAIRAIASTSTRSRGETRPRRIRRNPIRASCSNGCSATAAAPRSGWRG